MVSTFADPADFTSEGGGEGGTARANGERGVRSERHKDSKRSSIWVKG